MKYLFLLTSIIFTAMNIPAFGSANEPGRSGSNQNDQVWELIRQFYPNTQDAGISVLIVKDDQVLADLESGLANLATQEPLLPQSRFRMASVSKQFTAMAVYNLVLEAKIGFETPIRDIFPGLPQSMAKVQVKHLLQHSSGVPDYESLIPADRQVQVSDADVLELIQSQDKLYFEPGTQFRYSNTGFCLLALIAEKISARPYAEWAKKSIFQPLKFEGASLYEPGGEPIADRSFGYRIDQDGTAHPADQSITSATKGDGCVYISKAEYLTWLKAITQAGFPSRQYLQDLRTHAFPVKDGVAYSLGWFTTGSGQLFHSGETSGFRNVVYYDPGQKTTVIVFSNRNEARIGDFLNELLQKLEIDQPKEVKDLGLFFWMSNIY